jgi:diguanylate cyclase (GGDEF)-like protein
MELFDLRTVIVLTGLMSGLMALVMVSLRRTYPKNIRGLSQWSWALLLLFGGGTMTALRGIVPDSLGLTLANLLLYSGIYLSFVGTQLFFGVKPRPLRWIVLIVAVMLAQLWFTYFKPSYQERLLLANVLLMAMFATHGLLLSRQGINSFAKSLLFAVMAFMTAIPFLRVVTAMITPVGDGVMANSPFQTIYVTSFAFSVLLFSIGAVLLATDLLRTELEHLATRDSLTNALTRRRMSEVCHQELQRCKRNGHSMALLVMDLDHFKEVNDSHGHQAGDRVLVDFASRIQGLLRQPDQLGRLGGEEFLLLLPESSLEESLLVAERIRKLTALNAQENPSKKAHQIACTVSIGATTNQGPNDTVDAMLARADSAMYRAKANGRNRVEPG